MAKARLFIGSSSERLNLAYNAQTLLERDVEPTVWTQGVFTPSSNALASLTRALSNTDFALFIFAADDLTTIRGKAGQTVRDNVIFELGMAVGRLSSERCFILIPRSSDTLHLPTDLLGLIPVTFDPDRSDNNMLAALGPAW